MLRERTCLLVVVAAAVLGGGVVLADQGDPLDGCNVVWTTPSRGAAGSMPLGNGDIGVNLWAEAGGDLRLLLAKTDAWSGNGRLLKLGRVRVSISPNPFRAGAPFRQTLALRDGEVRIEAGPPGEKVALRVWVDAHRPVIHVEADAERPVTLTAALDLWRLKPRTLGAHEKFSAYGIVRGPSPIVVEADTVLPAKGGRVTWFHRNTKSCYPVTMKVQALGHLVARFPDPLMGRTFGGCIRGEGLAAADDRTLRSAQPARRQHLAVYALTAQTQTPQAWVDLLGKTVASADAADLPQARREHRAWWAEFWQRSWIHAAASPQATRAALTSAPGGRTNTLALRIGADTSAQAGNRFVGRIARVRIFDRALSADEVAALARQGRRAAVGPAKGLVAAWRFDKADGGVCKNAAGAGLDARIVGDVRFVTDAGGPAVELSGKGYLHVDNDPRLDLAEGFTLAAWIAPGLTGPTSGRIIDKTHVGKADGYLLDAWPNNSLRLITPGASPIHRAKFPPGRWVHVAATCDALSDARRLYVGGRPVEAGAAPSASAPEGIGVITRGYALQRFLNACAGRGAFPIKFNGSLFTVDGGSGKGAHDPDHRAWGGCYWFQNTRLPYWSMLHAGDFDLMAPLPAMYLRALPLARERTKTYYAHEGAYWPETMYFWGTYNNDNYGWVRKGKPPGLTDNTYIRYYWSGGLELSAMMLDRYEITQDEAFARTTLLPLAADIVTFYDRHWKRGPQGKILFSPAASLETWHAATNPLPEIAGLRFILPRLLALPAGLTGPDRRKQWRRMLAELPDLPAKTEDGRTRLLPAETFSQKRNCENPELYAVFPYRLFGLGKPKIGTAVQTFRARGTKRTGGWFQDAIQAAYLGLTGEAARDVYRNFRAKDPASRFPAFWQRNFDWVPDQDHGAVSMIALQRMLLQAEGRKILLLPAWPKDWDVDFKLHAPLRTTVRAVWQGGRLRTLDVEPPSRAQDVVVAPGRLRCGP